MDLLPTAVWTLHRPLRSRQPEHPSSTACFFGRLNLFFLKQWETVTRGTVISAFSVQLNWVYFALTNTLHYCIELFSYPHSYIPILLIRTNFSPLKGKKKKIICANDLLLFQSIHYCWLKVRSPLFRWMSQLPNFHLDFSNAYIMLREERCFLAFATVQIVTCVDSNKIHDGKKPHLLRFNAALFHSTIQRLLSLLLRQENTWILVSHPHIRTRMMKRLKPSSTK